VASAQYPDDATYDRAGVYASYDLQVTEDLNLLAGGRYENINAGGTPIVTLNGVPNQPFPFERTYQDWIGSLGFVYAIDPQLNFVGGVYEGFRAPTTDDLTADKTFLQNAVNVPTVGSLNVQPEHSLTYEVGLKLDADQFRGSIYQWWMELDDYITRVPDANNIVVLGNSNAQLHGTEFAGEYLFDQSWSAYGNFWYTWGNDANTGDVFPRIPPTQGTAGVRWRDEPRLTYVDLYTWMVADVDPNHYPRSLFNGAGQVTDARFPQGGTPGFATFNLRLGHTFGQRESHRVALTVYNITDKYYRVLGSGVDGEGFNALLTYEFLQ
jgi:hemoglobin/transferrin/lactoferrin receptor protein